MTYISSSFKLRDDSGSTLPSSPSEPISRSPLAKPGAGVADRGGEDGRRRVACDAVRGQGTSLHRYGSFHEIASLALSIDSSEGPSSAMPSAYSRPRSLAILLS